MIKLALPKMTDVFKNLKIFEKYGTRAAITDFAILFGGHVSNLMIENATSLKDRTGLYYTISGKTGGYSGVISEDGFTYWNTGCDADEIGFRLTSKFSKLSKQNINSKMTEDDVLKIEYGEYPQYAVKKGEQKSLEKLYN